MSDGLVLLKRGQVVWGVRAETAAPSTEWGGGNVLAIQHTHTHTHTHTEHIAGTVASAGWCVCVCVRAVLYACAVRILLDDSARILCGRCCMCVCVCVCVCVCCVCLCLCVRACERSVKNDSLNENFLQPSGATKTVMLQLKLRPRCRDGAVLFNALT